MFRRLLFVALFALAIAAPARAQSLPCIRFPFQATTSINVMSTDNFPEASASIPVAGLLELEQITIRLHDVGTGSISIQRAGITTVLTGKSVRHGIELLPLGGAQQLFASPTFDGDLTRLVKLYADPSTALGFDFHLATGGNAARIDVSVVGRLVSVGCWIGPQ